ncbi:hypothetical protein FG386_002246 [Cryptosporidium ryanae]|uniref:uncharacterized protein n=1 Tax=Cryptosporidium ryanae TaxID=515981 RepID=UPI00351A8FF8|nr:hypothetical protein FG386_002246 [Cryptosporidium ryanae]
MVLLNTINICQEFLKNMNNDGKLPFPDIYFDFFENFRNINQLFEFHSTMDNSQLEVFEVWNSILHCFKIILEKLMGIDINFNYYINENVILKFNNDLQIQKITEKKSPEVDNLHYTYEIVKEISLMFEKMRSFLEKNKGFISRSSTSSLSIVLILVKYLSFKKKSNNIDLIEKVQWMSLHCLSLLFRIYKLEFTESWDIILFPGNIDGIDLDQVDRVERYLTPKFSGRKDVPFLVYLLFSSSLKIRINTIICIQSIFSAPILRFKNMIQLLSSKTPDYFQDTSAFSFLNNIVNLTSSLIVFGNMLFLSNKCDIETKITLIKTFSQIVSSTPPLFWTNHFIDNDSSFLNSLSLLINIGVEDPNLTIPSLQLFSNLVSLNKDSMVDEELTGKYFYLSFLNILELNKSLIKVNMGNIYCSALENSEKSQSRMINIVIESMNFFLKSIIYAPFLIFRDFDKKKQFILLVEIIKYYLTNISKIDRAIFIKTAKVAYNLLDKYRCISEGRDELNNSQVYDTMLNPFADLQSRNNSILVNDEELHSIILDLVNSFIHHIFIANPHILSSHNINNCNNIDNIDILCEILNIFSLLNPIIIEKVYCKSELGKNGTFLNFIFHLLKKDLSDKLLPFIIKNLLCFCGNSGSLIKPFETFQNFEFSLTSKLISFIELLDVNELNEIVLININKAIIFISDYHEVKENGVIICSICNSKRNLNLIDFEKPTDESKRIEINCILDWKDLIYKYKSFFIDLSKNNRKLNNNILNISEIIRAFGHFSRLTCFSMKDYELLLWLLELVHHHIFQIRFNSFKLNKVKWNSIYSVGILFQNNSFNKVIIESFSSNDIQFKKVIEVFENVWNTLCSIVMNNSELTKVRINALRSITTYNSSVNSLFKIPHFVLLITWEMYFYANSENVVQIHFKDLGINSNDNQRYNNAWKSCIKKLSNILYNDTCYHLKNSLISVSNNQKEKLEAHLTKFNEISIQ